MKIKSSSFFGGITLSLKGNNLNKTSEGISFAIPNQINMIYGIPFISEGAALVSMENQQHHGAYFRDKKELQLGLKLRFFNASGEEVESVSSRIEARKQ